jgi:hypothetical protein
MRITGATGRDAAARDPSDRVLAEQPPQELAGLALRLEPESLVEQAAEPVVAVGTGLRFASSARPPHGSQREL